MTVLITGGMGFTGLHTAKAFLDAGQDVAITWYQTWREPQFIKDEYQKRVKIERVDVTSHHDIAEAVRKTGATEICHLAVPGLGALSAAEDFRVNMNGLINVLEAGRLFGVKRISVASSQTVYAGLDEGPFREDISLPADSRSNTEAFKKAWEVLALHWGDRTGVEVIILRLGGIVGPLYHTLANLMSRMVHAAVKGEEIDYTRGRGGVPFAEDTQDWGYVKNLARAIELLHTTPKLNHRIYNVGGGRAVTNQEIVDSIRKVIPDAKLPMNEGRSPRWRPNAHMDLSRLADDTGYRAPFEIPEAVADYIKWLQAGNKL